MGRGLNWVTAASADNQLDNRQHDTNISRVLDGAEDTAAMIEAWRRRVKNLDGSQARNIWEIP
jgi:hypothetical protein